MNIVNVGYDSTNYYVIADSAPRLLVDAGWPGTLPKLQHQCKRAGIQLSDITHFMVTHFHPDHAGLVQDLKHLGNKLIVLEEQVASINALNAYMKPKSEFGDIDLTNTVRLSIAGSRAFLAGIGLQGEIILTPGHSDDSVTLVLDEGAAFTGDLPPVFMAAEDTADTLRQSWDNIRSLGATTVYPGHGPATQIRI